MMFSFTPKAEVSNTSDSFSDGKLYFLDAEILVWIQMSPEISFVLLILRSDKIHVRKDKS